MEIIKINIDVLPERNKMLKIPEIIKVPQFSVVQWNLIIKDELLYYYLRRRGLIFTLYFEDNSPFQWKRNFIQPGASFPFEMPPNIIRLAEDNADKKGDYKYGVKIEESDSGNVLYDEDPLLIVF